MLKAFLAPLATLLLVTGCADDRRSADMLASVPMQLTTAPQDSLLAIEHQVVINVPEDSIESAHRALLDACTKDPKRRCTVLESSLGYGDYGTAMLRARVQPDGVESLITLAAGYGEILRRSTKAEDLAKPIVDTDKRIAMLESYLSDLLRLRQQSRQEIDALIRVAAEIAKTQAELDSAKADHAQLRQRVDLQILEVELFSERRESFSAPIGASLKAFRQDLGSGIAHAISGIALILPWLVILIPLAFAVRRLWKRFR